MNNYNEKNKLMEEIEKLVSEIENKKSEITKIENKSNKIKDLWFLTVVAGSALALISMDNGMLITSIISLSTMLGLGSFLVIKDYKYEDILVGKTLDLNLLNRTLNNKKSRYRELTNIIEKNNENSFNLDKEELKDLEQIFNEVKDEEITLEEKPKVRVRK